MEIRPPDDSLIIGTILMIITITKNVSRDNRVPVSGMVRRWWRASNLDLVTEIISGRIIFLSSGFDIDSQLIFARNHVAIDLLLLYRR